MTQTVGTGAVSYCNYGYEATYASAATGTRTFGQGTKLTISRKNNIERIYGLGARNATAHVAKKYEGSASIEFVMCNASWLRAVLGTVADAGAGPSSYTHTYSEANALQSFSIVNGTNIGDLDYVSVLTGAKVASATITAAQGEVIKCKIEALYKTETLATSGLGAQVTETESPYTFAEGSLQLPSGSTIGNVQTVELTINNNLEMLWGLGSRLATTGVGKAREYNLRMTVVFSQNTDLLTKFLGNTAAPVAGTPAEQATCILTFTHAAGSSLVITLANITFDTETLPLDVNEVIKEDVEGSALSMTSAVMTNSTVTDEGDP